MHNVAECVVVLAPLGERWPELVQHLDLCRHRRAGRGTTAIRVPAKRFIRRIRDRLAGRRSKEMELTWQLEFNSDKVFSV